MKIEFKFYDKRKNKIVEYLNCSVTPDGEVQSFNIDGVIEGVLNNRYLKPIMYTGKKDIHGDKIYDGFIIKRNGGYLGEKDIIGVVKLEECQWWIINEKEEKSIPLFSEIAEDEIMGNIYQNKKLAKELGF